MLVPLREPPNKIAQRHVAPSVRVMLAQVVKLREQAGAGLAHDAKRRDIRERSLALYQLLLQGSLAPHTRPLDTVPAAVIMVVQHDGALHADDEVQQQRRARLWHTQVVCLPAASAGM